MLKLQFRGSAKSVWLVGPVMKLGSDKTNDLIVSGTGVAGHHCNLLVNESGMQIEALEDNAVFLNDNKVEGKAALSLGDIFRVGTQEFVIIDPKDQTNPLPSRNKDELASSQETVFRTPSVNVQEASGWMIQGMHKSLKNKRYPIDGTMAVGRSQECELHFAYDRLSRKHAEFRVINGVLMIKDLDSSNGTYHNGEKVKQAKLHPGDTIAFDKLEFTVVGPASTAGDKPAMASDAMSQTVVRSAITPDMIKQARSTEKSADKAAAKMAKPAPVSSENEDAKNSGIIMVTGAIVLLAVIAAVILI